MEDILKIFSDLKESKDNLVEIITQIQKLASEIVETIDNDLYETIIRGYCPSFLKTVKSIFRIKSITLSIA